MPRCNDTAEGFLSPSSRSRDYSSSRRDAGQQNPAESARACSAQPNLNQQPQQQKSSLISPFSHIYLPSISSTAGPDNHSNAQSDLQEQPFPPLWLKCQCHKEETKTIYASLCLTVKIANVHDSFCQPQNRLQQKQERCVQ